MLTAGHPIGLVVVSTDHDYIIRITLPIAVARGSWDLS